MVARIIAIEEHFWTPALIALRRTVEQVNPKSVERLGDLGALRLRAMDEAGVDMQVLSEAEPGTQNLAPDVAVPLARESNDLLFEAVKRHPDRFAGFATLPTPDPAAAAKELERAVKELAFCGAMVHGSTHGRFLDERACWPILEAAAALDVPIYLLPSTPQLAVHCSQSSAPWISWTRSASKPARWKPPSTFDVKTKPPSFIDAIQRFKIPKPACGTVRR